MFNLTQKEIDLISFALDVFIKEEEHPENKEKTIKEAFSIMKKLNPNTTYHFGE